MIFYFDNPRFPCCIRVRVEVCAVGSKLRPKSPQWAADTANFVFSRTGKRPILRPRVAGGRKTPFPIRISVWD